MKIDEIVSSLDVLFPEEREVYVIVNSAALVLCGADIVANDVNLQARSDDDFVRSWRIRESIPTIRANRDAPSVYFSETVEASYSHNGNNRLLVQPFGHVDNIFMKTQGVKHLSPLGCIRWYQLLVEQFNSKKDHDLLKVAMDLYLKQGKPTYPSEISISLDSLSVT